MILKKIVNYNLEFFKVSKIPYIIKNFINRKNISTKTLFTLIGYIYFLKSLIKLSKYLRHNYISLLKNVPFLKNKIDNEQKKVLREIKNDFDSETSSFKNIISLPLKPVPEFEIENDFKDMVKEYSYDYKNGYVSGSLYSNNKGLDSLTNKLFPYFNKSNPLHTNLFPGIRRMENNCVSIMKSLFNGGQDVCGTFTSGGTESILLACKTYRDLAYDRGISSPEIIVSSTVHCAFNKASKYFKINLVEIQSQENGLFDITELEKKINKNTILVVASTPSYSLGIIDQVDLINDIVLKHGIYLHLDACIGAFLINFTKKYDFSLDGVSSISADFHKYGQSPKGASCILYKNKDIMKYQYFIDEKWTGGVYATNNISGSRCGNIVALTYATLLFNGIPGYQKNFKHIKSCREYVLSEINKIPELFIYGLPELSIIGIGSKKINIYVLSERLKIKKWDINNIQNPDGFHLCITSYHNKTILGKLISDIRECIANIKNEGLGNKSKSKCIYGTMQTISDNSVITDVATNYLHLLNNVNLDLDSS